MKKSVKTKMKLLGLATMSFAFGLCLQGANQNVYNAKADENETVPVVTDVVDSFEMVKGAWVRGSISDPTDTGLAFSATVDDAQIAALSALGEVKVGFAIAPKNYADVYALTDEYLFGSSAKYYFEDNQIDGTLKDGKMEIFHISTPAVSVSGTTRTYKGSIIDFGNNPADLLREYVCAGYIEFTPTGEDTPQYLMAGYFEDDVRNSTRSMVYVAQRALEEGVVPTDYIDNFTKTYLPEVGVLDQQVKYTTNVYVNGMLIESKTDNVANINAEVSYANATYANFTGYDPIEGARVYAGDNNTVLDIRLTAEENKVYEYLATWTAYNFSNPFQLIPITEGAETILDADNGNLSIKKLGAAGFGQTNDTTLTGNRQYLIKEYGLMGKEVEYLALYSNGTVTKYTIVPVTKKIANGTDLETIFTANATGLKPGVYVLTADIDMGDRTWDNNKNRYLVGSTNLSTYTGPINGFQGIFDGAGHTISNLTTEKTFFGSVHPGSIIRNIGFTNVKETTVKGFLSGVCAAELNNVYVSFAEGQTTELALTEDYRNGLVLNNVVIDYTNHLNTVGSDTPLSYRGVLNGFGGNITTLSANNNFFVISDMPMIVETDSNSTIKRIVDAYNVNLTPAEYMEKLAKYGFLGTFASNKIARATNKSVLRFDKASDMKDYLKADQEKGADKTLDLSGFNAKFWTFNAETGELTWNSANN